MKIEIFNGLFTIEDVKNNPDKLYIFEENIAKVGTSLQTSCRNLPNTHGLRVRKGPGTKTAAFFTDLEFINNKKSIIEDVVNIKYKSLCYKSIVFSSFGYGTGIVLENRCSNTWNFLQNVLRFNFDFDNKTGKKWQKLPSHSDITQSEYIKTFSNDEIINPVNNSYFLPHLLKLNLLSTYDLVKNDYKVSFTSNKKYEVGQNLILQFQNQKKYLVCRVLLEYEANTIKKNIWSTFEGLTEEFSKDLNLDGFFQIHIKFLCTLDENGKMEFRNDFFQNQISSEDKQIIEKKLTQIENESIQVVEKEKNQLIKTKNNIVHMEKKVSNEEIYNLLLEINSKLDKKSPKLKLPAFFKKRNLSELLAEKDIFGEIKDINNGNYEVITEQKVYFVKYKKGLLRNSIEVMFSKEK